MSAELDRHVLAVRFIDTGELPELPFSSYRSANEGLCVVCKWASDYSMVRNALRLGVATEQDLQRAKEKLWIAVTFYAESNYGCAPPRGRLADAFLP